jgi:hypothetical protein
MKEDNKIYYLNGEEVKIGDTCDMLINGYYFPFGKIAMEMGTWGYIDNCPFIPFKDNPYIIWDKNKMCNILNRIDTLKI